jgi:spermidine synthase
VIDYPNRSRTLWLNNTYLLEAGKNDILGTYRMGLLPTVLHPRAKRLAMIGVGTGISSSAFLNSRLEEIVLVEMIPEVLRAAREDFGAYNQNVLENPRVKVEAGDARRYLARETGSFDIICSDLMTPWHEGTAYLYTVDHFRNVRARLNAGGIFCLWLPLYQMTAGEFLVIARSFAEVFPGTTLWQLGIRTDHAVVALVGGSTIDIGEIREGTRDFPLSGVVPDLLQVHESGVLSRYVGPVDLGESRWKGVPLNTLSRPLVEFMAAGATRDLLRGKRSLDLLESFYALPANPGGALFSAWEAAFDQYRKTGWYSNLYDYHSRAGDTARATEYLLKVNSLPAVEILDRLRREAK